MGKIRVSTIGDESAEEKQKVEARKRAEEKKKQKAHDTVEKSERSAEDPEADGRRNPSGQNAVDTQAAEKKTEEKKKQKKEKFIVKKASPRSSKYNAVSEKVDKKKVYSLREAVELLPKLTTAKFDETVELHINTTETGITGSMTLPHGTGKKTRVVILNATKDPKAIDELVKRVESGNIDFDILIATPDSMSRLAKVARYLGPKGLMPNPKNGTVTTKPEDIAKKFEAGQINFKTEAKAPIMHLTVGKVSFSGEQLSENIKTALKAIQDGKIRSVTLKSTMSPGIKLDFTAI